MKLGVTKTFCAVLIAFLIVALGGTAQTQKQQGCCKGAGGGNPPWFNPGKNCKFKVMPYHYHAAGGIYINREQRRCKEVILVCGTMMVRESVVARDPGCGEAFWPDSKDGDEVCCEEFQKAVKSKQPCDPMQDADCDGIPNDSDNDPLKLNEKDSSGAKDEPYYTQPKAVEHKPHGTGRAVGGGTKKHVNKAAGATEKGASKVKEKTAP